MSITTLEVILFIGPPGCGKGTLASSLNAESLALHVSTGDLLRNEIKKETSLASTLKPFVLGGEYIPGDLMCLVLETRLKELLDERKKNSNFPSTLVLDGFPRTEEQAWQLNELIAKLSLRLKLVVFFELSEDVLLDRIAGRFSCANCSAVYHEKTNPPKNSQACDVCGEDNFVHRKDDELSIFKKRIAYYNKDTLRLNDYYRNSLHDMREKGKEAMSFSILNLDASRSIEEVRSQFYDKF